MNLALIILAVTALVLLAAVIRLNIAKRIIWEKYEVERFRREWDFMYLYYQLHPDYLEGVRKEQLIDDYPVVRKVIEKMPLDQIIKYIKEGSVHYGNGSTPPLPYIEDVDRFIDEIIYDSKPPLTRCLKALGRPCKPEELKRY